MERQSAYTMPLRELRPAIRTQPNTKAKDQRATLGGVLRGLFLATSLSASFLPSAFGATKPAESFPLEATLREIGSLNDQIKSTNKEIDYYNGQITNASDWLRRPFAARGFLGDQMRVVPTDEFLNQAIEKDRKASQSDEKKLLALNSKLASDQKSLGDYLARAPIGELKAKMGEDARIMDAFTARASPDLLVSTKNEVYSEMRDLDSDPISRFRNADRITKLQEEDSALYAAVAKCGEKCKGFFEKISESSFVNSVAGFLVEKLLPIVVVIWVVLGAITGEWFIGFGDGGPKF
ncbi:MAG TPA: hypothetical protein VL945_01335 [Candidatus Saccharimonadales bacterium]|nr:hypothetical protein [Candidatus Saccharimonadales bacterium]